MSRSDEEEFRGKIGRFHRDSTAWWPEPQRAAKGTPNVLLIVLDDVGFAQLGCFGSDIETPALDALARNGLRYSNFHTTALCSPTRACLLTGRNHHSVGMGRIIELATGFPGYNARIPKSAGFLPEMLVPEGFATWAVGKWHLTPEDECHTAATRSRWPLGRGFERFYGYFGGETHQFEPALIEDNRQTTPPRSVAEGYHLTEDLVDRAIGLVTDLRAIDATKPFFLYFCTGACHSPHQSPREWIDRYRGRFDRGWDAWREATLARQLAMGVLPKHTRLTDRPAWIPAWSDLSGDERRLYARFMEAFAGFLSHTDDQLARLFRFLEETGDFENTLCIVLSDNGASSEGGPRGSLNDGRIWNMIAPDLDESLRRIEEIGGPRCHNNYPWGWTVAGNTPFRRWKREVHEGGVCDPLIVHWPRRIAARGEVRRQYVHAIDVLPTILAAVGVAPPAAIDGTKLGAIEGQSIAPTFDSPDGPSPRDTQYFEMFGCRALYHRGWKAVTWVPLQDFTHDFERDDWELYDVEADPAESNDLAAQEPAKLKEMIDLWWREAERFQVLPLDNRAFSELVFERPHSVPPRARYVYRPNGAMVPEAVAVNVRNRDHAIRASVEIPAGGAEGVLIAQGSVLGGWSVYVKDHRLCWAHNLAGAEEHRIRSTKAIGPGAHVLEFRFAKTAIHQGSGTLLIDGVEVGRGEVPRFTPTRFSLTGAGLTCGRGLQLAVSDDYEGPFPFTGRIEHVVVEVEGAPFEDAEGEAEIAIKTQ